MTTPQPPENFQDFNQAIMVLDEEINDLIENPSEQPSWTRKRIASCERAMEFLKKNNNPFPEA